MAWLDDRAWCHPKLVELSDRAFRMYVNGLTYCSGMSTGGRLTLAQQTLICPQDSPHNASAGRSAGRSAGQSAGQVRAELVLAGLWDELTGGSITVHDWDEHNGKRDARRAADRERKRLARLALRSDVSAGPAHVEGSDRVTKDNCSTQTAPKVLSTDEREAGETSANKTGEVEAGKLAAWGARASVPRLPEVDGDVGW